MTARLEPEVASIIPHAQSQIGQSAPSEVAVCRSSDQPAVLAKLKWVGGWRGG